MSLSQGAALRLDLPDLQRLRPAADPPRRASWKSRSSTSSRTIPSASARTARRTSRSSNWRRLRAIPGLITLRPARRQRSGRGVEGHHADAARAGRPGPDAARRCRRSIARKYAAAAGVAKGAYVLADAAGRQARRDPDRHRQRGRRCASRPTSSSRRKASRPASSACRRGSCSSSRAQEYRDQRVAAGRDGARVGRAGVDVRLGSSYVGADRPRHRHAHLRRVGAAEGPAEEVRLHAGEGRRRREGTGRQGARTKSITRTHAAQA